MTAPKTIWILGRRWTLGLHDEAIAGGGGPCAGICDYSTKTITLWAKYPDLPGAFWHEAMHAGLCEVSDQKEGLDDEHACNTFSAVKGSTEDDPRNKRLIEWLSEGRE